MPRGCPTFVAGWAYEAWLQVRVGELPDQCAAGVGDDGRFRESLAAVIEEYTTVEQRALDPFAGYGTTLVVAERLQRDAVGVRL